MFCIPFSRLFAFKMHFIESSWFPQRFLRFPQPSNQNGRHTCRYIMDSSPGVSQTLLARDVVLAAHGLRGGGLSSSLTQTNTRPAPDSTDVPWPWRWRCLPGFLSLEQASAKQAKWRHWMLPATADPAKGLFICMSWRSSPSFITVFFSSNGDWVHACYLLYWPILVTLPITVL